MSHKWSSRGGRHGKKGGKWKPLCAATASADWGEGYYQPSPQSGYWWWSEEWHPEAPWKPLCAATASADWGEGYYQPSPQSGYWWWSEEWHPEAPSETSTVNALLKMAQELQELAKTPWTREQWIDQVRCVQDGCDDTPNDEKKNMARH